MKNEQKLKQIIIWFFQLFYIKDEEEYEYSTHSIKLDIEKFIKTHMPIDPYVSKDILINVIKEMGFRYENCHIFAKKIYPSRIELEKTFSIKLSKKSEVYDKYIFYYDLESLDIEAMTQSYSQALEVDSSFFPTFHQLIYNRLSIIKIDDIGFLSYLTDEDNNTITLDSIYSRTKKEGIGNRLFNLFTEETKEKFPHYKIYIEAYTEDSKAFFKRLAKKYKYLEKSYHLKKDDLYVVNLKF